MGIGVFLHGTLALANLCVGNLPGAFAEGVAVARSYGTGLLLEEIVGDTDWADVADTSAFW